MITSASKPLSDRPWLDPAARPQIVIDGVSKSFNGHIAVDCSRFVADFVGTTNLFEGTVSACTPGLVTVRCPETGGELLVDDAGDLSVGQRVWVALRPEKVRLAKQPSGGARVNQLRGTVWELGYLGNRSIYRVKTANGKVVTVFAQNERRTSEAAIDWSDEVFVSWGADAAVLLPS